MPTLTGEYMTIAKPDGEGKIYDWRISTVFNWADKQDEFPKVIVGYGFQFAGGINQLAQYRGIADFMPSLEKLGKSKFSNLPVDTKKAATI